MSFESKADYMEYMGFSPPVESVSSIVPDAVEVPASVEAQINYESLADQYTNVVFEPGSHPVIEFQYAQLAKQFEENWYGTHLWNDEVAQRLNERQPNFLGMDSLVPTSQNNPDILGYKQYIWQNLPAAPRLLNASGGVTVVAGDVALGMSYDTDPQLSVIADAFRAAHKEHVTESTISIIGRIAIGALATGAAKKTSQHAREQSYDETTPPKTVSRRTFIAGLGVGAGALAASGFADFGAIVAGGASARVNEVDMSQDLLTVSDTLSLTQLAGDITDGRTALVAQKTREMMASFSKPTGESAAVVMGSAHSSKAEDSMSSSAARETSIVRMLQASELAIQKFSENTQYDPEQSFKKFLKVALRMQSIQVTEPDVTADNPDINQLYSSVNITADLISPMVARIVQQKYPQHAHVIEELATEIRSSY